jgi:hypothetical protein
VLDCLHNRNERFTLARIKTVNFRIRSIRSLNCNNKNKRDDNVLTLTKRFSMIREFFFSSSSLETETSASNLINIEHTHTHLKITLIQRRNSCKSLLFFKINKQFITRRRRKKIIRDQLLLLYRKEEEEEEKV